MADLIRFVNTASAGGGNGETNGEDAGGTNAFASLVVAESALDDNGDLVADGNTLTIICMCGSGTAADTAVVNFDAGSWTTGASNDITIKTDSAEANSRHVGVYNTGTYRIEAAVNDHLLRMGARYMTLDGIQFSQDYIGVRNAILVGVVSNVVIQNCIVRCTDDEGDGILLNGAVTDVSILNCIIYKTVGNTGDEGILIEGAAAVIVIFNCTIAGWDDAIEVNSGTSCNVTNCAVFDNAFDYDPSGGGTIVRLNCANDDTNAHTGEVDLNNNDGDEWDDNFEDWANFDYRLKTGGSCVDAGISTGAPGTDIAGTSRPQNSIFDISAFELEVVAGGVVVGTLVNGGLVNSGLIRGRLVT